MERTSARPDRTKELSTESPLRLLFKYSWPALVAMTLNALYAVVDRFYSFTTELTCMHKKAALLAVAWDDISRYNLFPSFNREA